jgi:hypothetical protein
MRRSAFFALVKTRSSDGFLWWKTGRVTACFFAPENETGLCRLFAFSRVGSEASLGQCFWVALLSRVCRVKGCAEWWDRGVCRETAIGDWECEGRFSYRGYTQKSMEEEGLVRQVRDKPFGLSSRMG